MLTIAPCCFTVRCLDALKTPRNFVFLVSWVQVKLPVFCWPSLDLRGQCHCTQLHPLVQELRGTLDWQEMRDSDAVNSIPGSFSADTRVLSSETAFDLRGGGGHPSVPGEVSWVKQDSGCLKFHIRLPLHLGFTCF